MYIYMYMYIYVSNITFNFWHFLNISWEYCCKVNAAVFI